MPPALHSTTQVPQGPLLLATEPASTPFTANDSPNPTLGGLSTVVIFLLLTACIVQAMLLRNALRKLRRSGRRTSLAEELRQAFGHRGGSDQEPGPDSEGPTTRPPDAGPVELPAPIPTRPSPEFEQLLFRLADLHDEFLALKAAGPEGDDDLASHACQRIADQLLLSDAELIRDESWNPERQRAVEVKAGPDGEPGTIIVSTRASGLALNGTILRKQEVVIQRTSNQTT